MTSNGSLQSDEEDTEEVKDEGREQQRPQRRTTENATPSAAAHARPRHLDDEDDQQSHRVDERLADYLQSLEEQQQQGASFHPPMHGEYAIQAAEEADTGGFLPPSRLPVRDAALDAKPAAKPSVSQKRSSNDQSKPQASETKRLKAGDPSEKEGSPSRLKKPPGDEPDSSTGRPGRPFDIDDLTPTEEEIRKATIERSRSRTTVDPNAPDPEQDSPPGETEEERRRRKERVNGRRKRAKKLFHLEQLDAQVLDLTNRNEAMRAENDAFRRRLAEIQQIFFHGGVLTSELFCLPRAAHNQAAAEAQADTGAQAQNASDTNLEAAAAAAPSHDAAAILNNMGIGVPPRRLPLPQPQAIEGETHVLNQILIQQALLNSVNGNNQQGQNDNNNNYVLDQQGNLAALPILGQQTATEIILDRLRETIPLTAGEAERQRRQQQQQPPPQNPIQPPQNPQVDIVLAQLREFQRNPNQQPPIPPAGPSLAEQVELMIRPQGQRGEGQRGAEDARVDVAQPLVPQRAAPAVPNNPPHEGMAILAMLLRQEQQRRQQQQQEPPPPPPPPPNQEG
ncbi:expressed unknown protein [Seminavis robusta]|uniref:BZIP domain-containing protein n=1 Tax=Seminavis robusta TaxID=568900 RepID=A0A9N8EGN9_9STRA|nr:expressed unknown protein [Seminavis robusta]|eukprot:Sro919_g220090.1 n/a (565) ;mRNA; r:6527-8386